MKIAVNGVHIHLRDCGVGEPTLVFLHYWGGSSRTWDEVVALLSDRHRCISLDHRGWGQSDAPAAGYGIADLANDAEGVISAMALRRFVLVGHSMGGKTAQLIASRRVPGLVGLVLIAPSPPTPTILSSEERDQMMHAYDTAESVAFVRDHILTASPLTESQKERVIQDSLRGGHAAKLGWIETAMREDLRTEARKIEVPTLVLSGDQDRVDPPARLRAELMPHIAGAELRTLAGLGHLSMLEAPDAVAQAIREFISGLPVLGSTDL